MLGLPQDTCYKPIEFLTEEQRDRKVEAFKRGYMTVSSSIPESCLLKQLSLSVDPSLVA